MTSYTQRPASLKAIACEANSLKEFGLLFREWNQELRRRDISNRPALERAIAEEPPILAARFSQGAVADAYLAACADWVAIHAGLPLPSWANNANRTLGTPWFANNDHAYLLAHTPAPFRQRGIFTIPETQIQLRRGRPKTDLAQKREKARLRNRRYRDRIRHILAEKRPQ